MKGRSVQEWVVMHDSLLHGFLFPATISPCYVSWVPFRKCEKAAKLFQSLFHLLQNDCSKKNQNTPYLELLYITLQLQQKNRLEKQQQFLCKLILPAALTYWNSATNINADILKHVIITVNYAILCSLRLPWSKWAERTVCLKKQAYFLQWKQ